jgi:hypothetical protein
MELPIEWMGALKFASIDAQRRHKFSCGSRENDALAYLRYRLEELCREVVEQDA